MSRLHNSGCQRRSILWPYEFLRIASKYLKSSVFNTYSFTCMFLHYIVLYLMGFLPHVYKKYFLLHQFNLLYLLKIFIISRYFNTKNFCIISPFIIILCRFCSYYHFRFRFKCLYIVMC